MSFKTAVKVVGETESVYNQLVFETKEEAEKYGKDLAWRWTMVTSTSVEETTVPVNAKFCDGKLEFIPVVVEEEK